LFSRNKIPQAISAYREAIALEPNLDAYNLGNLLTQTGEFEQAEATCQAIAANPSHFGLPQLGQFADGTASD